MVGAASSGIAVVVVKCGSGEGDDGNKGKELSAQRKMLNINQQGHVCRSLKELAPIFMRSLDVFCT